MYVYNHMLYRGTEAMCIDSIIFLAFQPLISESVVRGTKAN